MYKIGEFSIITGITVKALRYYHQESLLIPSNIDSQTSYRLYDSNQIMQARQIKLLRDCGFSIKEIQDIFEHSQGLEDLPYYIEEKLKSMLKEAKKVSEIKKKLLEETKDMKGDIMQQYEVYEKTSEKQLVLSTKYVGKYSDCGQYFGVLYKQAKQHACGVPMNLYYDAEYKENASIEVCVPIKKEVKVKDHTTIKTLEENRGIATIHVGPWDQIGDAYKALHDYAKENNLELILPSRETYIKGPGMLFMGNPNKYKTELFIPIKTN